MSSKLFSRHNAVMGTIALAVVAGGVGLAASACAVAGDREARADAPPPPAKVTASTPLVASVSEGTEHTGRTEAVETVDVRPRSSGHLQRVAFREGEMVKKGDLLFVVDPRPYQTTLARARAELARAQSDQQLGAKEKERSRVLFGSNVISERDWDNAQTSLVGLGARTQEAEAAVSQAELDLEYAYVKSPINGKIGRMYVTPGNLVGPAAPTPLATVVSVDPIYVYVDLDEARALRLGKNGRDSKVSVGFGDESGHPHEGTVDFVDNKVDPQTGTLRIRVSLDNKDQRLTPGLFARIRLPEGQAHDAVLVADRAVSNDQDRRYVYVIDSENKIRYRPVKLGGLHNGLRIVREGLTPSDRVVVKGLQRVRPGAPVAPEMTPMTATETAAATKDGGAS